MADPTVRHADLAHDLPALLEIGERFAALHPCAFQFSAKRTEETLRGMVSLGVGVVIVGEIEGTMAGVLVGIETPVWFTDENVAAEMALWVEPHRRGGALALRLLEAFETWAKGRGLRRVTMSDLRRGDTFPAGVLFERRGYRVVERSHTKEV